MKKGGGFTRVKLYTFTRVKHYTFKHYAETFPIKME
jgi:hypothetical protein